MSKKGDGRIPKGKWVIVIVLCIIATITIVAFKDDMIPARNAAVNQNVINERMERNKNVWNRHAVDSAVGMLKSGDLVVRTGIDVSSYLLCQMNQTNKTYSHCGIVVVEHGYPFVYHCIGGEDNPNAKMRRDSASYFFSPINNMGFGVVRYDIGAQTISRLDTIVRSYYKAGKRFDMQFDLQTDDRFYCAELVYKSLKAATNDSNYIRPVTVMGYTFVGIDNLFLNKHAKVIWQVKFK